MRRHFSGLVLLPLLLAAGTAFAEEKCGCAATNRPCEQETLASAALPVDVPAASPATIDMSPADCWDCGVGDAAPLAIGFVAITLFIFASGLRRVFARRSSLLVGRLDRLGGVIAPQPDAAPAACSPSLPIDTRRSAARLHSFFAAIRIPDGRELVLPELVVVGRRAVGYSRLLAPGRLNSRASRA